MGSPNLISVGVTLNDLRRAVSKLASLRLNADSTPTFAGLTLSGLTAARLAATDSSSVLVSSDLYSWVTETSNQVLIADDGDGTITLSTPQDIHTGASPTFANLSLGTGELTAGSINRAVDTLTLEIAGTPELSISTDLIAIANGLTVDTDTLVVDAVEHTVNGLVFKGTATDNIAIGSSTTLDALTTGNDNIAIGRGAGSDIDEANGSFLMGVAAGANITSGMDNICIGKNAGFGLVVGGSNVLIGRSVGFNLTGSTNVAIGLSAFQNGNSAFRNTCIGSGSLFGIGASTNDHKENTAIGYRAGYSIDTGDKNIYIGQEAGFNQNTLNDILIIDNQDRGSVAAEITDCLIYGVMDATPANQSLRINGEILGFFGAKLGDGTNETRISATGIQTMAGTARVMKSVNLEPSSAGENPGGAAFPDDDYIDDFFFHRFDPVTEESVTFHWEIPHDYAAGGTVHLHNEFVIENPPSSGGNLNVRIGVEYKKISLGEAFDFSAATATLYSDETIVESETPFIIHQDSGASFNTSGWVAGDVILMRLFREVGVDDTYDWDVTPSSDNDVWMFNHHLEYLCDKIGEAT